MKRRTRWRERDVLHLHCCPRSILCICSDCNATHRNRRVRSLHGGSMQRTDNEKPFVASAAALLLGMTAAQADNAYVSVLGGPTFAPDLSSRRPPGIRWIPASMSAPASAPPGQLEPAGLLAGSGRAVQPVHLFRHEQCAAAVQLLYGRPDLSHAAPTRRSASMAARAWARSTPISTTASATMAVPPCWAGRRIGGVEYRASEWASLFAEYRYQNAHDVNAGGLTQVGNRSQQPVFRREVASGLTTSPRRLNAPQGSSLAGRFLL